MKTITLLAISLLMCITATAQTNYYSKTKTFYEQGYTYQCDVGGSGLIRVYNKSNRWTYEGRKYKATGKIFGYPESEGVSLIVFDKKMSQKRYEIVDKAFSAAEKKKIKEEEELYVTMYINTTTGNIDEVLFEFFEIDPYVSTPISTFRKIELELKKNLHFKITDKGKEVNYALYWFSRAPQ